MDSETVPSRRCKALGCGSSQLGTTLHQPRLSCCGGVSGTTGGVEAFQCPSSGVAFVSLPGGVLPGTPQLN